MYKIKTPNKRYSGVTEGVAFADGTGYTDCKITRNILVNDYGYKDTTDYTELQEKAKEVGRSTVENATDTSEDAEEVELDGIDVEDLTVDQLKEIAKDLKLTNYSKLTKKELIELIESASKDETKIDA